MTSENWNSPHKCAIEINNEDFIDFVNVIYHEAFFTMCGRKTDFLLAEQSFME